ncbi:MAG: polysaccharide pyruvyl transferase family protein [Lachnospiraceae bacterium]|nr:polysaccharide pyruvyl transferase family protein [Lachnospiraceae bacterium]
MFEKMISVVVTTHNQSDILCDAIDSILCQSWKNTEIIIVDDASTDDTLSVVENTYGNLDNIIYIVNEEQVGLTASKNIGASHANGEYIAFLNPDMIWVLDKLEKQMKQLLSADSDENAVYCSCAYLDKEGDTENGKEFPEKDIPLPCKSKYIYPCSLTRQLIDINALLIRKNVFENLGGFNTELQALQEYEFCIRLAQLYAVDYIPEILVISHQYQKNEQGISDVEEIITQSFIVEAHYDNLLQFGLLEKKLEAVLNNTDAEKRDIFLQCLSTIDRSEVQRFIQKKEIELDTSNRPQQLSGHTIEKVQDCVGCMSCYSACGQGAIRQEYDEEGFAFPKIDEASCIHCGKCVEVCPLCNMITGTKNPENCYAVQATDEIRSKCSSGGVFPVLAEYFLQKGGWVAGVVYTEEFAAKHIVSNRREDVEKMFSSKYVQSDMSGVYEKVEELLEEGEQVLFSGCACQMAALHTFLNQKEYPNLLTVDVVCHGVPSPKVFAGWLSEQQEISSVSFRDKQSLGWAVGFYMEYRDGSKSVEKDMENPYTYAFLNNWILRNSCYDCHFKKQKYSDITVGDFWGIHNYEPDDDGFGTSFVTENTIKGGRYFRKLRRNWKYVAAIETIGAVIFNKCINASVGRTKFRQIFFENWNRDSLEHSICETKKKVHFDIALVLMWTQNYGNALTNYALYTYLQNQGYKVLALDNISTLRPVGVMGDFAKRTYELSSGYFTEGNVKGINESCDCFMVGSDQIWNYNYQQLWKYGDCYYLHFVEDGKKRLSYASSFGHPQVAISAERGSTLFQKFDKVSVREEFGVSLCREKYGVEAQKVVDPVFLLSKEEYMDLASHSQCEEKEPFIMAYILTPTEDKRKLCLEIQKRLGIKLIVVLDCYPLNEDHNQMMMGYENTKCRIPLEDWMYYMSHCQYVISDSFHGTCFSIIFNKPFVTIRNREKYRFATFEKYDVLAERIVDEDSTWYLDEWVEEIDYTLVQEMLSQEIEESKEFLRCNLSQNIGGR